MATALGAGNRGAPALTTAFISVSAAARASDYLNLAFGLLWSGRSKHWAGRTDGAPYEDLRAVAFPPLRPASALQQVSGGPAPPDLPGSTVDRDDPPAVRLPVLGHEVGRLGGSKQWPRPRRWCRRCSRCASPHRR